MYIPSRRELHSREDFDGWPRFGRVGYCSSGVELTGTFVLVIPDARGLFGAYGCVEDAHSYELDIIAEPATILEVLRENPVRWCPPELDELVERRTVDFRRTYRRHALLHGDVAWMSEYWRAGGPTETQRAQAAVWPDEMH